MTISDVPLFTMLKTRMRWHQDRQKLLAENVANSETPHYRARDLRQLTFADLMQGQARGAIGPARTDPGHMAAQGTASRFAMNRNAGQVTTPDGNGVNLEDEMLKVAQNQLDYQAASGLYQRSLGLIRTAIGRRGQ